MILTEQQSNALNAITDFMSSDKKVFVLTGYAGTGKTTMIRSLIDEFKDENFAVLAPTGKAAKILRDKANFDEARTVHSFIYCLDKMIVHQENDDVETTHVPMYFPLNIQRGIENAWTCIVDEASMISSRKSGADELQFGSGVLLEDLMHFISLNDGSKIIFVGDPAQLPPVGDKNSNALDCSWFIDKGYGVSSAELTEIVRQSGDSAILENSLKIRHLLKSDVRNELKFVRREGEVMDVSMRDLVDIFVENWRNGDRGAIITYMNASALSINRLVRDKLGMPPGMVAKDDCLVVVQNSRGGEGQAVFNGDMMTVKDICSDVEKVNVRLKKKVNGETVTKEVVLEFVDALLLNECGETLRKKLLLNLIDISDPGISEDLIRALYVDFCIRNRNIKDKSEISRLIVGDPYFNALRVKFGYSITGHKSQGGEWNTAYVDYASRTNLDTDSLRWLYTVTTRAKRMLYGVGVPDVKPLSNFSFSPTVIKLTKVPNNFISMTDECVKETPFHRSSVPSYLKRKYWDVCEALGKLGVVVDDVKSIQWKEMYIIGGMTYEAYYSAQGMFRPFAGVGQCDSDVLEAINNARMSIPRYEYAPGSEMLSNLHVRMVCACDDAGITVTNIVPGQYNVRYFVIPSPGEYGYIDFWYNSKGLLTRAQAASSLGADDVKLSSFRITDPLEDR